MKNIALVGGGTGGHIYPLVSLYNSSENLEDVSFIWFGEESSLEQDIAIDSNIDFISIKAGKVRRYFDIKNFFDPFKNIIGFFQSLFYIFHYNIDIIFSKGGYVSIPVCFAAKLLGKKIYIHESDAVPGLSNKMISRFATKVFYSFDNENIDNEKHILTGQIVNPELIKSINRDVPLKENNRLEVLVFCGSQGSTIIFENLLSIIKTLNNTNLTVVLGTKNLHFKEKFEEFPFVTTYEYISQKDLAKVYKKTDIAITRGGATTLWELYFFGIHSIIIPLSNSAQNHQEKNAEYFKKEVGSDVLNENKNLNLEMFRLLTKYQKLRKGGLNLGGFNYAAERIKQELTK